MDNIKDDRYYLNRIITDISFILAHTDRIASIEALESDEVRESGGVVIRQNGRHRQQQRNL